MVKPFIIGTSNAREMLEVGIKEFRDGGSAIDAAEAVTKLVELNPEDTSVGKGGIPNLMGTQEMDASIMDGKTLRSGAVGAIKGFKNPISVARKIMEESPHVLLVGEGAELFADKMGFEKEELSTELSRNVYTKFIQDALGELPDDYRSKEYIINYVEDARLRRWYETLSEEYHGTVNVIAMDEDGNLASAVSTSGTALKLPGRLGDTPIIGAGNYCDNRYGAATCTGRGEIAITLNTTRTIISYMENGLSVREACFRAMKDVQELNHPGSMSCLGVDRWGKTTSASTRNGRESVYYYMDINSKEPEKRSGVNVRK
jgi:beta-aspartyl-peptidase (threonine type)